MAFSFNNFIPFYYVSFWIGCWCKFLAEVNQTNVKWNLIWVFRISALGKFLHLNWWVFSGLHNSLYLDWIQSIELVQTEQLKPGSPQNAPTLEKPRLEKKLEKNQVENWSRLRAGSPKPMLNPVWRNSSIRCFVWISSNISRCSKPVWLKTNPPACGRK